jgi:hypothetical protein
MCESVAESKSTACVEKARAHSICRIDKRTPQLKHRVRMDLSNPIGNSRTSDAWHASGKGDGSGMPPEETRIFP